MRRILLIALTAVVLVGGYAFFRSGLWDRGPATMSLVSCNHDRTIVALHNPTYGPVVGQVWVRTPGGMETIQVQAPARTTATGFQIPGPNFKLNGQCVITEAHAYKLAGNGQTTPLGSQLANPVRLGGY